MAKRFYWFSYYIARKGGRDLRLHQLRDGAAFAELAMVLAAQRYKYDGLVLNYPSKTPVEIDFSFLNSNDVLVLTTRPPLDDEEAEESKRVEMSHTTLEGRIFEALRYYFRVCTRSQIALSESMAKCLPAKYANRAVIEFRRHGLATTSSAAITGYSRTGLHWTKPAEPNLTAVYTVYTPPMWPRGPKLIVSFGMAGTEGLVWAYLLRTQFPELLSSPRFFMAEMSTTPINKSPHDLTFAKDWKVDIVLDRSLP